MAAILITFLNGLKNEKFILWEKTETTFACWKLMQTKYSRVIDPKKKKRSQMKQENSIKIAKKQSIEKLNIETKFDLTYW